MTTPEQTPIDCDGHIEAICDGADECSICGRDMIDYQLCREERDRMGG